MNIARKRAAFWFLLATLWLGLTAFVSLNPAPPGLETLDDVASWFPHPKVAMSVLQAIVHAFLFGIWALFCARHSQLKVEPLADRRLLENRKQTKRQRPDQPLEGQVAKPIGWRFHERLQISRRAG